MQVDEDSIRLPLYLHPPPAYAVPKTAWRHLQRRRSSLTADEFSRSLYPRAR